MPVCIEILDNKWLLRSKALWHFVQGVLLPLAEMVPFESGAPHVDALEYVDPRLRMYGIGWNMVRHSLHPPLSIRHVSNCSNGSQIVRVRAFGDPSRLPSVSQAFAHDVDGCLPMLRTCRKALPVVASPVTDELFLLSSRHGNRQMANITAPFCAWTSRMASVYPRARCRAADFAWIPYAEQLPLLRRVRVIGGYHGSNIGALHVWTPIDALAIEWLPDDWPYCIFATCAMSAGKKWILSAPFSTTQNLNRWKPRGFYSALSPPTKMRKIDPEPAFAIATDLLKQNRTAHQPTGCAGHAYVATESV